MKPQQKVDASPQRRFKKKGSRYESILEASRSLPASGGAKGDQGLVDATEESLRPGTLFNI